MRQIYTLDDTMFDILAFGKDAQDVVLSGPTLSAEEIIRSSDLMHDAHEKHVVESQTKNYGELSKQAQESLSRLWELNQDDIFPDPGRVRATREIFGPSRQHDPDRKGIQGCIDRLDAAIGMKMDSRRLFSTKDGRVGIGPQSLTEGDEIWVFDGEQVPFVLRERRAPARRFIGQTFLLGAMHGEIAASDPSQLVEVFLE